MLGDPGSREAGTFRQPGSRSAVRDHLLGGSAPARQKLLWRRCHRIRQGHSKRAPNGERRALDAVKLIQAAYGVPSSLSGGS